MAEKLTGDGIGVGIRFDVGDYVTIGLAADYEDGPDASTISGGDDDFDTDDLPDAIEDVNDARDELADNIDVTAAEIMELESGVGDDTEVQDRIPPAGDTRFPEAAVADANNFLDVLRDRNLARVAADPSRPGNTTRYGIAVKVKLGELPVSVTGGWQNMDVEGAGRSDDGSLAEDSRRRGFLVPLVRW